MTDDAGDHGDAVAATVQRVFVPLSGDHDRLIGNLDRRGPRPGQRQGRLPSDHPREGVNDDWVE